MQTEQTYRSESGRYVTSARPTRSFTCSVQTSSSLSLAVLPAANEFSERENRHRDPRHVVRPLCTNERDHETGRELAGLGVVHENAVRSASRPSLPVFPRLPT